MKSLVEHWSPSQDRAEGLTPGSKLKRLVHTAQTISLVLLLSAMSSCSESKRDNASTCEGNCVRVHGSFTETNGTPVAGATAAVQLGTAVYSGTTDGQGQYSLEFPKDNLPPFFSGYLSKSGFLPQAIPFAFQDGTVFTLKDNFNVQTLATTERDVVFSKGIALNHLGDDNFGGTENSQFQISSQGTYWVDSFTLSPEQIERFSTLTVTLRAKGLQCTSVVTSIYGAATPSGGQTGPSEQLLDGVSPVNGSFGLITTRFPLRIPGSPSVFDIPPGTVYLYIRTDPANTGTTDLITGGRCPIGDADDFEFLEVLGLLS